MLYNNRMIKRTISESTQAVLSLGNHLSISYRHNCCLARHSNRILLIYPRLFLPQRNHP
jgi:hypothetical protein